MKSRWIINILLVVAIVILTLVARYEPGIEPEPLEPALTDLRPDAIKSIRVDRPLREPLLLGRTANGWIIDREPALPADPLQVRALLRLAQQTAVRSYPVAELELSRLALDPPYEKVTLDGTSIDFGSLEPLEELRYVRVGDQVHLIRDSYQHIIEADYTQLVRRRLLGEQTNIVGLSLPELALSRTDAGWSVEPPQDVSADTLQVLIDSWQRATALYIRSADKDPEHRQQIVVTLADPARQITYLVVSREPELVLARPEYGIEYRMGGPAESLLTLPDAEMPDAP